MRSRTLKLILSMVSAVLGIAFCICLYFFASRYNNASTIVGYIGPSDNNPYLELSVFENKLTVAGNTLIKSSKGETAAAAADRMLEAGASVIVIAYPDDPAAGSTLLDATTESGTTLLFVGSRPRQSVLSESDKAWYLGSDEAHGGELLGAEIANDFKAGTISDVNEDHLLQVMVVNESPLTQYALEESEHLGVYTSVLTYNDDFGNPLPYTAEAFADAEKPEFILCSNDADARMIYEFAREIGWQDLHIGCAAPNKAAAQALHDDKITDLPVPYYDVETVTSAAVAFTLNALDFQFVSQDTDLSPNSDDRFIVPYQLFS